MRRPGTNGTGRKAEGRRAVEQRQPHDPESLLLQVHRFLETEASEAWTAELVEISRCERQVGPVTMRMSIELHSSGFEQHRPAYRSVIDVYEEWAIDSSFARQDAAIQRFTALDHLLVVVMQTAGYATRRYLGSDRLVMRFEKDLQDLQAVRREIEWVTHSDLGVVDFLHEKVREARIDAARVVVISCERHRRREKTVDRATAVPCGEGRCTR